MTIASADQYRVYGPTRHTALRHPQVTGVFPSGALPLFQPASLNPPDVLAFPLGVLIDSTI